MVYQLVTNGWCLKPMVNDPETSLGVLQELLTVPFSSSTSQADRGGRVQMELCWEASVSSRRSNEPLGADQGERQMLRCQAGSTSWTSMHQDMLSRAPIYESYSSWNTMSHAMSHQRVETVGWTNMDQHGPTLTWSHVLGRLKTQRSNLVEVVSGGCSLPRSLDVVPRSQVAFGGTIVVAVSFWRACGMMRKAPMAWCWMDSVLELSTIDDWAMQPLHITTPPFIRGVWYDWQSLSVQFGWRA